MTGLPQSALHAAIPHLSLRDILSRLPGEEKKRLSECVTQHERRANGSNEHRDCAASTSQRYRRKGITQKASDQGDYPDPDESREDRSKGNSGNPWRNLRPRSGEGLGLCNGLAY